MEENNGSPLHRLADSALVVAVAGALCYWFGDQVYALAVQRSAAPAPFTPQPEPWKIMAMGAAYMAGLSLLAFVLITWNPLARQECGRLWRGEKLHYPSAWYWATLIVFLSVPILSYFGEAKPQYSAPQVVKIETDETIQAPDEH